MISEVRQNARFTDHWHPRIVAELNDQYVKLVKVNGEFVWHHHDVEDELFYVVRAELRMKFRDHDVTVKQGEMIVVPKGVEHKPAAEEEVHLMLIEPKSKLNTGNVDNERTVKNLEWI